MYLNSLDITIGQDCIFENNTAKLIGGKIYNLFYYFNFLGAIYFSS